MSGPSLYLHDSGRQRAWLSRFYAEPPPAGYAEEQWQQVARCAVLADARERDRTSRLSDRQFIMEQLHLIIDCARWELDEAYPAAVERLAQRRAPIARAYARLTRWVEKRHLWNVRRDAAATARTPLGVALGLDLLGHRDAIGHCRRQFAVGQGGFHAGGLRFLSPGDQAEWVGSGADLLGETDLLYVYDCGSEPRKHVDREIKKLVAVRACKSLDLLFLSHFDRDHVCGISRLLAPRKGLRVDTIVMPFVDDAERLIALGRAVTAGQRVDALFRDLVVDPVAALERFEPREVILVMPGDDEDERGGAIRPPERGGEGKGWTVEGTPRSGQDGPLESITGSTAQAMTGGAFVLNGTKGGSSWCLRPYVRKASKRALEDFGLAAELLLGWESGSFHQRIADKDTRRHVVSRQRTKLARAYAHAFKDKNLTSLSLYSGPLDPSRAGAVTVEPEMTENQAAKIGWIGTGDANLKEEGVIRSFERHYANELGHVSTFVLPHHGSIHNSDPDRLVSQADYWVVAAEPVHRHWEHPAEEVRAAAERRGAFRHVRGEPETEFSEVMLVF